MSIVARQFHYPRLIFRFLIGSGNLRSSSSTSSSSHPLFHRFPQKTFTFTIANIMTSISTHGGSSRKVIFTPLAPAPIGPYSQAVSISEGAAGQTVYLSGQVGVNPRTREMISAADVGAQATQAFTNMKAVIESAGGRLSDVVKINIFITDMASFKAVNEAMMSFFAAPYPARSTVAVAALPLAALVEIEAIAHIAPNQPGTESKL